MDAAREAREMAQVSKANLRWTSRPSPLHFWRRWLVALSRVAGARLLGGEASDWMYGSICSASDASACAVTMLPNPPSRSGRCGIPVSSRA